MNNEENGPRVINLCLNKSKNLEITILQKSHIHKTKFSPINIPLKRRLQTFMVLGVIVFSFSLVFINIYFILNPFFWIPYLLYIGWIAFVDRNASKNGGRNPQYLREMGFWKHFRGYFPANVVETKKLDPKKKYLFAFHPHGIIGMSVWANFLNNMSGCLKDINYRICTLNMNFFIPFAREWLLSLGLISADKESITNSFNKNLSVGIVIGGAAEALDARPGDTCIVLGRRKGFVKMALQNGADLVPIFLFGENDVYDQLSNPRGSGLRKFQNILKSTLGISLPFFHGRGIFNYRWGLLPFREPLTSVIGAPISVPHVENPTDEQVVHYHNLYIEKLTELYEEWSEKLNVNGRLFIVE
eukprot:TRINITY_DN7100_c0_g1_i2.p1 TRINITY_DN7100_c0_g1~~TRINITY_DN7100_c0_g1_i2.p1  ORF type:complete len:358 (-),score=68.08 TRINITY_DN7100_c0_g1_i2:26-1099(-)